MAVAVGPVLAGFSLAVAADKEPVIVPGEVIDIRWEPDIGCATGLISSGGECVIDWGTPPVPLGGGQEPDPLGGGGGGGGVKPLSPECKKCQKERSSCLDQAQATYQTCSTVWATLVAEGMCKAGVRISGESFTPPGRWQVTEECVEWTTREVAEGRLPSPCLGDCTGPGQKHESVCARYRKEWVPTAPQDCVTDWMNGTGGILGGTTIGVTLPVNENGASVSIDKTIDKRDGLIKSWCQPEMSKSMQECTQKSHCGSLGGGCK